MTGFGRAEGVVKDHKVTVEVRSLNGKQLDLMLRLHGPFKERETELRQLVGEGVVRGKAEVHISAEPLQAVRREHFNRDLVRGYYNDLRELVAEVAPEAQTDLLGLVLRMPEVSLGVERSLQEDEWEALRALLQEALKSFDLFRATEGGRLSQDLAARVRTIERLLQEAEELDNGRMDRTRERLRAKLAEVEVDVDRDRFEQELIYYLEKLDITEEKVRLRSHCTYFIDTLNADEQQGRKLNFITQEMGREINTLGSKANDAAIQRLVVVMKDELEKIKEQVMNVL